MLLYGWPGSHVDYRQVTARLDGRFDVVAPDLRGFGQTKRPEAAPDDAYHAAGQVRSVAVLIDELDLGPVVVGAYDIGSRVALTLAQARPDLVRALVLAPPLPGVGARLLESDVEPEIWYAGFHRSGLAEALLDGDRKRVRAYLRHFWGRWSAPGFELAAEDLERLVDDYAPPGAFAASIRWYKAGVGFVAASRDEQFPDVSDRVGVPVDVLWPEHDAIFPRRFADRLDRFLTDVRRHDVDGVGHFVPVEAPGAFAERIKAAAGH